MRSSLVILLVLGLFGGQAAGDPRPMSAGAHPAPTTSTQVALVSEDLTIRVVGSEAFVRARLSLRNLGGKTNVVVGFPCEGRLDPDVAGLDCRTRIAVKRDGKKVATKRKGRHWVWPLRLGAGAETELEIAYRAPIRNPRYKDPALGVGLLHYRLTTGAAWAGPIRELRIRVELPTETLLHIAPAGYRRSRGVIEWHLRDVDPRDDVAIVIHPYLNSRYARAVKRGKEGASELRALAAEITQHKDRLVKQARILHRAMGKKLGLREPSTDEIARVVAESARLIEAAAKVSKEAPCP